MSKQNLINFQAQNSFRIRQKQTKQPFLKVGHYLIGELLGKGGYASVYKAFQMFTKSEVAVKVIDIESLTKHQIQQVKAEIQIHKTLKHPNVVRIYEVVHTQSKTYIFMELIKGKQLYDHINKRGPLRQSLVAQIFYQICSAVKYIHSKGIAHRDIKAENIMIDSEFKAKLIDFGLAAQFNKNKKELLSTFCGSPSYTAPQMLQKQQYSGTNVDVWCLGVTLYVLLEASLPFDRNSDQERKNNIRKFNWNATRYSSKNAVDLYEKIFCQSSQRMTIEELLNSDFFRQNFVFVSKDCNQFIEEKQNADQFYSNQENVSKICHWLNLNEKEVMIDVIDKNLTAASALYQLLKIKCKAFGVKSLEINMLETEQRTGKSENKKVSLSQKQTRPSSKSDKINVLPLVKGNSQFLIKEGRQKTATSKVTLEVSSKNDIIKGEISIRNKLKSRNICRKNINIQYPKSRLRKDDTESPRRLIDCIKRYN